MKKLILLSFVLFISACTTSSKTKEAFYEVNTQVWSKGVLLTSMSVRAAGTDPAEISSTEDGKSISMKYTFEKAPSDLIKMNVAYTETSGDSAWGDNFIVKGKSGSPITIEKEDQTFKFKVIKL